MKLNSTPVPVSAGRKQDLQFVLISVTGNLLEASTQNLKF